MKKFLPALGNFIWRSDTRHSEAVTSWVMFGVALTYLFQYADKPCSGYLLYSLSMLAVAVLGFSLALHGGYVARVQGAMLRSFCWPIVGLHGIYGGNTPIFTIPFYAAVTLADALIYIKLYLLVSQRRENGDNG
jgi:hypothetical protein